MVGLPFIAQAIPKRELISLQIAKFNKTLNDFKDPYEAIIDASDFKYKILFSLTKHFIIPYREVDGEISYEMNVYGEYLKAIGQCRTIDLEDGIEAKQRIMRFESDDIYLDGKITKDQFDSFIDQSCLLFEYGIRQNCNSVLITQVPPKYKVKI